MSDRDKPSAQPFEALGYESPRILEHDDYASLLAARFRGQRVYITRLNDGCMDRPRLTQTFVEQSSAIGTLGRSGFLRVLDSATADTNVYVVFEHVDGVVLDDLRASTSSMTLSPDAVAELGVALATALEALHAARLTHGDLTPRGVLISQSGIVHITPVPLGCIVRGVAPCRFARRLAYQAPEAVVQAALRVEPSADIYSLGVILWEALCGRPLICGDTLDSFIAAARSGAPLHTKLERVAPAALANVILRALDRTPARRPSASEIRTRLSALVRSRAGALAAAAQKSIAAARSGPNPRAWAVPTGAYGVAPTADVGSAARRRTPLPWVPRPTRASTALSRSTQERRSLVVQHRSEVSMTAEQPTVDDEADTTIWRRTAQTSPSAAAPDDPRPSLSPPPPEACAARESGDSVSSLAPVALSHSTSAAETSEDELFTLVPVVRTLLLAASVSVIVVSALLLNPAASRRALARLQLPSPAMLTAATLTQRVIRQEPPLPAPEVVAVVAAPATLPAPSTAAAPLARIDGPRPRAIRPVTTRPRKTSSPAVRPVPLWLHAAVTPRAIQRQPIAAPRPAALRPGQKSPTRPALKRVARNRRQ
jgi:serine/threonine protein kinase